MIASVRGHATAIGLPRSPLSGAVASQMHQQVALASPTARPRRQRDSPRLYLWTHALLRWRLRSSSRKSSCPVLVPQLAPRRQASAAGAPDYRHSSAEAEAAASAAAVAAAGASAPVAGGYGTAARYPSGSAALGGEDGWAPGPLSSLVDHSQAVSLGGAASFEQQGEPSSSRGSAGGGGGVAVEDDGDAWSDDEEDDVACVRSRGAAAGRGGSGAGGHKRQRR